MQSEPQTKRVSKASRAFSVVAGIAVALLISEFAAASARGHAFAYLNVFEPDARLGVRLAAGRETAVRSFEGRVTQVAINAQGFRGRDWQRGRGDTRVLLLGDSQMFAYNVAFEESVATHLEAWVGARVYDAAVPSWGPGEYALAAEELVPEWRPTHVVFVANVANDWFENEVPNRLRTTARDGWLSAVHPDLEPVRDFPGREFLLGRSHLVFAARSVFSHVVSVMPPRTGMIDELQARLPELARGDSRDRSRVTRHLRATVEVCRVHGCQVIAAALPLDVQVDSEEWAKYGVAPRDVEDTEVLAVDFVADAQRLGLPAVNLLGPLRASSPGAFLGDDYHLSPRGHRAVAEAIAGVVMAQEQTASIVDIAPEPSHDQ